MEVGDWVGAREDPCSLGQITKIPVGDFCLEEWARVRWIRPPPWLPFLRQYSWTDYQIKYLEVLDETSDQFILRRLLAGIDE